MKKPFVRLLTVTATLAAALPLNAATHLTRFDTDPLAAGWLAHGDTNLFFWDSANQNLRVTWDSTRPNSYFHRPLGVTLTRADGFRLAFDLTLDAEPVAGGMQLAIGLLRWSDASATNFFRGSGTASPNVAEFDYFPDTGWGASLAATLIDASNRFDFVYAPAPLVPGVTYRIELTHAPGAGRLTGRVFTNGVFATDLPFAFASPGFGDFTLDTLAVCSYSGENAYGSSIFAQGVVDNLAFTSPLPVAAVTPVAPGQVAFASDAAWLYTLEQSTNLVNWTVAAPPQPGNGATLLLQATNPPADAGYFRVRAELP